MGNNRINLYIRFNLSESEGCENQTETRTRNM